MGVVGAESYVLASVLNYTFPVLPPAFWIFLMYLLVTLLNIRGIKIAGTFQDVITYGLILSVVLLSLIAFQKAGFQVPHLFSVGGPAGLVQAVAVGVFLFVGFYERRPV